MTLNSVGGEPGCVQLTRSGDLIPRDLAPACDEDDHDQN